MHSLGVENIHPDFIKTWSNNFAALQIDNIESIMRAILDFIAVFNHAVLWQFVINVDLELASSWLISYFGFQINGTFDGLFANIRWSLGNLHKPLGDLWGTLVDFWGTSGEPFGEPLGIWAHHEPNRLSPNWANEPIFLPGHNPFLRNYNTNQKLKHDWKYFSHWASNN